MVYDMKPFYNTAYHRVNVNVTYNAIDPESTMQPEKNSNNNSIATAGGGLSRRQLFGCAPWGGGVGARTWSDKNDARYSAECAKSNRSLELVGLYPVTFSPRKILSDHSLKAATL